MREIILKPNAKDTKTFHCQIKAVNSQTRVIEGWANTRFPDRVNDIVDPQAFADSLAVYMANPVVLASHDQQTLPVGKTLEARIAQDGLWVKIEIAPKGSSQLADEVWNLIEFGALKALSIGYRALEVENQGDYFVLKKLELLEISVVAVPANRESLFSIAKSYQMGTDLIEKKQPLLGWALVEKRIKEVEEVISKEFNNLPTKDKIFVESFLKRLQDVINSETDLLSLECEVLELENALH